MAAFPVPPGADSRGDRGRSIGSGDDTVIALLTEWLVTEASLAGLPGWRPPRWRLGARRSWAHQAAALRRRESGLRQALHDLGRPLPFGTVA